MKIKKFGMQTILIGSAFVIGLSVGTVSLTSVFAKDTAKEESVMPSQVYSVNKNGQTYGSSALAKTPEEEPDLVAAYGIDNTFGYVYSYELEEASGGNAKTPEQALEEQKERQEKGNIKIPLYKSDGKTVIGEFEITVGGGAELSPEEIKKGITIEDKIDRLQ
jgi:hypothetical protein